MAWDRIAGILRNVKGYVADDAGDIKDAQSGKRQLNAADLLDPTITPPGWKIPPEFIGADAALAPFLWLGDAPPAASIELYGQLLSRTTYADLFAIWGETYGAGDGETTFKAPDPRGLFPRFYDKGAGVDPDTLTRSDRGDGVTGDRVGTLQKDNVGPHHHPIFFMTVGVFGGGLPVSVGGPGYYLYSEYNTTLETRPRNMNFMLCVRVS
jgi:hypothetical protein